MKLFDLFDRSNKSDRKNSSENKIFYENKHMFVPFLDTRLDLSSETIMF